MKNINIDNEKEILKKCDFDYFYNTEKCSRELCMFYNDILLTKRDNFDKKSALLDLQRIAITLNEHAQRIKELEEQLFTITMYHGCSILEKELKQSRNSKAIDVLEKVRKFYNTNSDSDWIIDLCELDDFVDNQIKELEDGGNNE